MVTQCAFLSGIPEEIYSSLEEAREKYGDGPEEILEEIGQVDSLAKRVLRSFDVLETFLDEVEEVREEAIQPIRNRKWRSRFGRI